jgi:hypothetical protein
MVNHLTLRQLEGVDCMRNPPETASNPINLVASILAAFSKTLLDKFFTTEKTDIEDAYAELSLRRPLFEVRFSRDGRKVHVSSDSHPLETSTCSRKWCGN